ncbi:MAG: hypothetical protein KF878_13700 [Planctomycetes bacterium]|nr:hypothetical protein [Planctomycetota bacterium]
MTPPDLPEPRRDDDALLPRRDDLPPVVARLVIEVRSDGTRTVARGGLEDVENDQRVAVHAEAGTPLELSRLLLRSLLDTPRQLARSLVGGPVRAQVGRLIGWSSRRDDDV